MNKQQFIDKLRAALNGRIAPGLVTDNVNYYEDYINMEIRKGRSEAEVLQMLGDPRLIARTIIETTAKGSRTDYQDMGNNSGAYREAEYTEANQGDAGYYSYGYQSNTAQDDGNFLKKYHLPGWLVSVIVIVVIVLIFSLIFSVLSFLAPIIIPVFVVIFLVKLFRDWLN